VITDNHLQELLEPHSIYQRLAGSDFERKSRYQKLFSNYVDRDCLRYIRESLNRELVTDNSRFIDDIEKQTNRKIRLGKAGRPKHKFGIQEH